MLKMRQENLISDLSEVLENVYSTLNVNFTLDGQHVELKEVFQYWGLLPIFLHDKQSYIHTFCENELPKGAFANIIFNWIGRDKNSDTLLSIKVSVEHNLINTEGYTKFLKFLTTLIVTDSALSNMTSDFALDNYYDKFYAAVNNISRSSNTK